MLSKYLSTVRLKTKCVLHTFAETIADKYSLGKYQQCKWQDNEQIQTQ